MYKELHEGLHRLYKCDHSVVLSETLPDRIGFRYNLFRNAVKHLHLQGEFTAQMLADEPILKLIEESDRALRQAADYGLADNELPKEMIRKLQKDVFIFSGCKTYHELQEVSLLLRDEKGHIKPFEVFRREVDPLHQNYNVNYLEAEYDFAISSVQSAAQWVDIETDGDKYDLQYRTAGDDHVRADHAVLNGTTLPASHEFWNSYMPPNGWRCRCRVTQTLRDKYPQSDGTEALKKGAEATTELDGEGRNRAAMFRFNPGKQGVVFPENHPYRRGVDSEAKKVINDAYQRLREKDTE